MKGQSCEFDDGKPYQVHAAEFMVSQRDAENGRFHVAMWFCRDHFLDYVSTLKDGGAESSKGDEATK